MKEFYLVPKHVAQHWKTAAGEQKKEKNSEILENSLTSNQKEPISGLKIREIDVERNKKNVIPQVPYSIDSQEAKPSLDGVLTIVLKSPHLPAAKEIMKRISNIPELSWDALGNFNPPLQNLNVVEFLKFILSYNVKWTKPGSITDMLLLTKIANIPSSFINNPSAKSLLAPKSGGCVSDGRVGGANKRKSKLGEKRWLPY